ncbi:DUF7662 domain-containing protein [Dyadobacter pollutisoli]|uniref:DUF7662 domain-containing protein n=1 Tax=Dyadobacter pollutisoli TaxID=2910158 RepID=A0A9E8SQ32_9BACT|nr:hypothetical protein [Dyadobacter pollutisoli]WAC12557.1 hypothetical protein ON006_01055 [Dyadobacter pollutisoli]
MNETSKYFPLQVYLKNMVADGRQEIKMSLADISALVGGLPNTAYKHSAYWGNDFNSPTHVQKPAWLSIGLNVIDRDNISLKNRTGTVTFGFAPSNGTSQTQNKQRKTDVWGSAQEQVNLRELSFSDHHSSKEDIKAVMDDFIAKSNPEDRYTSFDYCYNYFRTTKNPNDDLEKSCLVLGFYLSSWGMFRGSSFLFQKSIAYFKPLLAYIAEIDKKIWEIDVNNYTPENMQKIVDIYSGIKKVLIFDNNRDITLVTKILLGVFGFIPAFDQYFQNTFKGIYKDERCSFSKVDVRSLSCIKHFYELNKTEIDQLSSSIYTTDFSTGEKTHICYPKAKIIDMYGFSLRTIKQDV